MTRVQFAIGALFAFMLVSQPVFAQSLTGNVGSAGITDGEQAVEFRIGIDDDGDSTWRLHYDNALTDWYQIRFVTSFSRPDGDPVDYRSFKVENWFQLSEEDDDNSGINGGFRVSYAVNDGRNDVIELRLTATDKFADAWEWRANMIGDIEVGSNRDRGVELESRVALTRALNISALRTDKWRAGVELFSEYGDTTDIFGVSDQAHQIGPVIKASWRNGIYILSAMRFGLTDASDDAMLKFFLGKEF